MKSRSSKRAVVALVGSVACILATIVGCNETNTSLTGPGMMIHKVSLAVHDTQLVSCQVASLGPTVTADTFAITGLKWTSTDSTVARPDSVGGVIALAPGSVRIKATSIVDTTKFDTARVLVVDSPGPFVNVASIQEANNGSPAQLNAVQDSVDVYLNVARPGCRTTALAWVRADVMIANAQDTLTQSLSLPNGISGAVFVRLNTDQLAASGYRAVPNGAYLVSAKLTSNTGTIATTPNPVQITIANPGG